MKDDSTASIFDTLTEDEQREIRQYLRDRRDGKEIDLGKLPKWLADLEESRQDALKKKKGFDELRKQLLGDYTIEKHFRLAAERKLLRYREFLESIFAEFDIDWFGDGEPPVEKCIERIRWYKGSEE